ncbi:MAG: type II toxin-antitoxin system VapC family toxin [Candidatus Parabeggiatoa sp.]|nr:type II toxin-antitoxin system VapC family toxin [Candidatus Parabeggiatoa sp.]
MLVDTDVLVWFLRGHLKAVTRLNEVPEIKLSTISYMELVQGMRNKQELQALRKTIKTFQWEVLLLNSTISQDAMNYVETFFHSHALRLADALIGATAIHHGLTLLTANNKHYQMINELNIEIFRP